MALTYERVGADVPRLGAIAGSVTNTQAAPVGPVFGRHTLLMRDPNIFTHRCDDMPDWRLPEDVAATNAR